MDANPLTDRARALEDSFFREAEARRRRRTHEATSLEAVATRLGIAPELVPRAVRDAEVTPEICPAFELMPLVEVAWVDGSVATEERWRVLMHGVGLGLVLGEPAHERIEIWLRERPDPALFEAWHRVAAARLDPPRDAPDPDRLRAAAEAVAAAAGGVFGLRPVSGAQAAVLRRLRIGLGEAA